MTRFLSESLDAREPYFRRGISKLESANGHPAADIRITGEIKSLSHGKLSQLNLDPRDTTSYELYQALNERIKNDDRNLTRTLRTLAATQISAEADPVEGMVLAIKKYSDDLRCFAIKSSRLRSVLRDLSPKKTMRTLGYRSLDSMLKHESPVLILAAASITESEGWQKKLKDHYKKLKPTDFEDKSISILYPKGKSWDKLASKTVIESKHNFISFKELGAIIFFPLEQKLVPEGAVTASLCLALHEVNEIRASSSFLKFNLVKADFGSLVASISDGVPLLTSTLIDKPMPWHLIHRYYAKISGSIKDEIFEPYLEMEDLVWHPIEKTLAKIEPSFEFWKGANYLGQADGGGGGKPVSFNIIDSALNLCNKLSYENRIVSYFQQSLWHELLLRYLSHENVERSLLLEMQPQLAEESIIS